MKRVVTAAIAIPLVLFLTLYVPNLIFATVIGVVAALAAEEFFSLGARKGIGRPGRWFLVPVAFVGFSFLGGWVLTAFVAAVLVLMTVSVFSGAIESALGRVAIGLAGIGYCSL